MRIQLKRGEVYVTSEAVLEANLGSCVAVCLYHPDCGMGGMNHIYGSRSSHNSPSSKYIRQEKEGYFYADNAVPRLLSMIKNACGYAENNSLHMAVIGGFNNEGPVIETMQELGLKALWSEWKNEYSLTTRHDSRYKFRLRGYCINNNWFRKVSFDVKNRRITINRKIPYEHTGDVKVIDI